LKRRSTAVEEINVREECVKGKGMKTKPHEQIKNSKIKL
jgi:hypothetical protein